MRKLCCEICCGMSITQFEEMSADNSTAVRTLGANINTTTEKSASFVDPAWQIATAVEFYFRYAVIAIGIFGTAANGLVLYALIDHNARSVKKRVINLLIINQNLLDLLSCILLVICHSVAVSNLPDERRSRILRLHRFHRRELDVLVSLRVGDESDDSHYRTLPKLEAYLLRCFDTVASGLLSNIPFLWKTRPNVE